MVAQGVDSIWQTRQAPRIIVPKPQNISTEEALNSVPVSSNAKTICVLDTGTDLHHPLLRGVVLDAFDLTSDNMPQDSNGHGTFITGLAAYGNLENRSNLQATARIISVKILGNNSDSYLENLLEQAVERFHNSTGIFTLSIMYNECCKNSEPTELTYTIDMLSRKHNVLFTICTGNITQDLPSLMKSFNYPTYFGDPSCRIFLELKRAHQ